MFVALSRVKEFSIMPTGQPSSAPTGHAPAFRDDLTAAAVLHDDALDRPAGGGGLGTAAPMTGAAGAAMPNSPIDAPVPQSVPHDGGDAKAAAEARAQAVTNAPPEPGHMSR